MSSKPCIGSDLEEWLNQSFSREHSGVYDDVKLEPIQKVLACLPGVIPEPITVAGTKGKGSTIRFLEQVLLAHDKGTVVFTSPHVRDIHERWRINGQQIEDDVALGAADLVAQAERECDEALTYFERCFAIACVVAAQHRDHIFICEVGLGGRLDCANALDAQVAVLTHLSHDHCHVLGHELTQIAREKLAIARPGRPFVLAPQSAEAQRAIEQVLDPSLTVQWAEPSQSSLQLGLLGQHQRGNAGAALAVAQIVCRQFDSHKAARGLAAAQLAARCQVVHQVGRSLIIDGAHNGPSIEATLAVAAQMLAKDFLLVLGCATDKEIDRMLAVIPANRDVIRCGYAGPRACGASDWPIAAMAWPWSDQVEQALVAYPGRDLCITGSFYLAAEALAAVGGNSVIG